MQTQEVEKKAVGPMNHSHLKQTENGWEAAIKHIKVQSGFNVRKDTVPDPELAASVKENGILNPIHVRANEGGDLLLVDGERRLNAAKKNSLETVPVIFHNELDDAAAIALSLTANDNQKPLNEEERAEGFKRLSEFADAPEIARIMGVSKRQVNETLRALEKGIDEIKEGVKKSVAKGGIPTRVAARAADLPPKVQKKVAAQVKGKSTKEGLRAVQKAEKALGKTQRGRAPTLPLAKDAKRRLNQLEELLADRLKHDAKNVRMLAHFEVVCIMRGDRDVKDIYLADGGMAKLATGVKPRSHATKTTKTAKVAKRVQPTKKAKVAKVTELKTSGRKVVSKKARAAKIVKKPAINKGGRKGAR